MLKAYKTHNNNIILINSAILTGNIFVGYLFLLLYVRKMEHFEFEKAMVIYLILFQTLDSAHDIVCVCSVLYFLKVKLS